MELRAYMSIVLKWWWLFLICPIVAAAPAYWVSRSTIPIYRSTTTVMVGQVLEKTNPNTTDLYTSEKLAQTYGEIVRRQPVLQATVGTLNLPMSWQSLQGRVSVRLVEGTQLMEISVTDTDPEQARTIADEVARQLILQSPTSPEKAAADQHREFVQRQLGELQAKIDDGNARLVELDKEVTAAFSSEEAQKIQNQINTLRSQVNTWQSNYAQLLNFLGQTSPNYLSVIEPAQRAVPINAGNTRQNVLLAAVVGLMIAGGIAFLLEYLDDTIKTPDDVAGVLGLTTLGSIVHLEGSTYPEKLITHQSGHSPAGEAYRMLRSNIQFTSNGRPVRTLLVTSASPMEGKSVTLANMGVVFAQNGLRTILVDSDLRRPVLHKIFQIPNRVGLSNTLLAPVAKLNEEAIQPTEIENLRVMTSGPLPPNPSELLGSARMSQLIGELAEIADAVIFDSPPVLSTTDAALLANRLDATILVTYAGHTRREAALRAVDQLQRAGSNLLGGVVNRLQKKWGGYYYYYYHYYSADGGNRNGNGDGNHRRSSGKRAWWKKLPLLEKKD
jgi:succinoglycan biosynthesis transport protein ExoP